MGLFRRAVPMDPAAIERMKTELANLKAALDHQRSTTHAISQQLSSTPAPPDPGQHLDELAAKLAELASRPAPPDASARVEELAAKLVELEARAMPDDPTSRLDELAAKLAAIDERVTSVSTELANQLTELSHEIDGLESTARSSDSSGPDEAVLGELRESQVRLAGEQARYQIAFREDLARIAEQLRRPPV